MNGKKPPPPDPLPPPQPYRESRHDSKDPPEKKGPPVHTPERTRVPPKKNK